MINNDTGNTTTQKIYEIATQPTFVDRSQDQDQDVSWEVSDGEETPIPPQLDQVKEDNIPPQDDADNSIDQEIKPGIEEDLSVDQEESDKKKKKNRVSEKNRIAQLTRELRQAQSVAHDVLSRNQYLETKITQKEKETVTNQENYLNAQKERIKKYLTDAIEEGNPEKITEANDLLAQYNSEILWLKKEKLTEESKYVAPNVYQEPVHNSYQEEGKEWIEKNSWANPNSSDFDQEMYEDADSYSIRLARKYKLEGRGSEVGTADFFDDITNYIKNAYDVSDSVPPHKTQTRERIQMKTDKSPPVGAVNRQGIQGGESSRKPNDITLTPEQKEIAHALRGYVRDPKTGQKVNDSKTLEQIYARNLMRGSS